MENRIHIGDYVISRSTIENDIKERHWESIFNLTNKAIEEDLELESTDSEVDGESILGRINLIIMRYLVHHYKVSMIDWETQKFVKHLLKDIYRGKYDYCCLMATKPDYCWKLFEMYVSKQLKNQIKENPYLKKKYKY